MKTSLQIAEITAKDHSTVMRTIRRMAYLDEMECDVSVPTGNGSKFDFYFVKSFVQMREGKNKYYILSEVNYKNVLEHYKKYGWTEKIEPIKKVSFLDKLIINYFGKGA